MWREAKVSEAGTAGERASSTVSDKLERGRERLGQREE